MNAENEVLLKFELFFMYCGNLHTHLQLNSFQNLPNVCSVSNLMVLLLTLNKFQFTISIKVECLGKQINLKFPQFFHRCSQEFFVQTVKLLSKEQITVI